MHLHCRRPLVIRGSRSCYRDDIIHQFLITRLRNCSLRESTPERSLVFKRFALPLIFIRIFCAAVIAQLCPNRILICALRPDLRCHINPLYTCTDRCRRRRTLPRTVLRVVRVHHGKAQNISDASQYAMLLQLHAAAVSAILSLFFSLSFFLCVARQDARRMREILFFFQPSNYNMRASKCLSWKRNMSRGRETLCIFKLFLRGMRTSCNAKNLIPDPCSSYVIPRFLSLFSSFPFRHQST